jgi:hypothetical protein
MYNLFLYKIDKTASRREPWNAHYFEWRLLKIFFFVKRSYYREHGISGSNLNVI